MAQVVTIEGVTPAPRYDARAWESVQISESATAAGPYTLIDTQALDPVDADPTRPAARNFTTSNAALTRGFYVLTFYDALGGTQTTDPISVNGELLTLSEYKLLTGIDPTDTRQDAKLSALLPAASLAIRRYTERDFAAPTVTEQRSFPYDGSGFLDIDDAADITEVRFVAPNVTDLVLDTTMWTAAPARRDDSPVYYYLVIGSPYGYDPAMGFERNLDVLAAEGRLPGALRTALVTATWGWPEVPDDVKQAAVWTVQAWATAPSDDALASEAIEGYSRSWSRGGDVLASLAIPNRARDVLAAYQKTLV